MKDEQRYYFYREERNGVEVDVVTTTPPPEYLRDGSLEGAARNVIILFRGLEKKTWMNNPALLTLARKLGMADNEGDE